MLKKCTMLVIVLIIFAMLASACSVPATDKSVQAGGAAGAIGATGATGVTGPTGATGPAGQAGAQGSAGDQGQKGAKGAKGATGPVGAQGPAGVQGPTGATGAVGAQGVTGPPVTMMGEWSPGTTYAVGSAVTYIGSSYISLQSSNTGHNPVGSSAYWAVLAQQGATGIAGPPGATGAPGPLANMQGEWSSSTAYNIGDCVTYNGSAYYGISGSINVTPPSDDTVWLLMAAAGATGPTGVTGATGATGAQGPEGPIVAGEGFSAYISNVTASDNTQLTGWTVTSPYYDAANFDEAAGTYQVPATGKYSIKATINYATTTPVTVSIPTGVNPLFTVRRTSTVTTDLVTGYIPIFDVNVSLVLMLRTILASGTVTLSNEVELSKDDVISLYYEPDGLTTTLNLGNTQGIYFSVHRIA